MVNLYNIEKYGFRNLVSNLFNVDSLEKIHEIRKDLIYIQKVLLNFIIYFILN